MCLSAWVAKCGTTHGWLIKICLKFYLEKRTTEIVSVSLDGNLHKKMVLHSHFASEMHDDMQMQFFPCHNIISMTSTFKTDSNKLVGIHGSLQFPYLYFYLEITCDSLKQSTWWILSLPSTLWEYEKASQMFSMILCLKLRRWIQHYLTTCNSIRPLYLLFYNDPNDCYECRN